MIVFPYLESFFSNLTIYRALKLSSPDVGSSRSTKLGSVISSTPIAVLFLSPPEINFYRTFPILVSAAPFRPRSSMI
jgi:hypothetical protein